MASGTTQWAPLWQFLWGDTSQNAAQIQQQLEQLQADGEQLWLEQNRPMQRRADGGGRE